MRKYPRRRQNGLPQTFSNMTYIIEADSGQEVGVLIVARASPVHSTVSVRCSCLKARICPSLPEIPDLLWSDIARTERGIGQRRRWHLQDGQGRHEWSQRHSDTGNHWDQRRQTDTKRTSFLSARLGGSCAHRRGRQGKSAEELGLHRWSLKR